MRKYRWQYLYDIFNWIHIAYLLWWKIMRKKFNIALFCDIILITISWQKAICSRETQTNNENCHTMWILSNVKFSRLLSALNLSLKWTISRRVLFPQPSDHTKVLYKSFQGSAMNTHTIAKNHLSSTLKLHCQVAPITETVRIS
jgi:hypothetical protein